MSEQMPQASEQQIVDTVMSIHHEAAEAVKGEIDTRKIAVGAVTQNIWSMDIGHGGHLSFEERHINVRLPTDAPVQDSYFTKLPIYVDLPDERQGDFTIVVRPGDCYFIDEDEKGVLSRAELLGLLNVRDARQLWPDLKRRTTEAGVRRDTTRELTFHPLVAAGPSLYTEDIAVNGVPMSATVRLSAGLETDDLLDFEGVVDLAWADGVRALKSYAIRDEHSQTNNRQGISQARLSRMGDTALSMIIDHIECADQ